MFLVDDINFKPNFSDYAVGAIKIISGIFAFLPKAEFHGDYFDRFQTKAKRSVVLY